MKDLSNYTVGQLLADPEVGLSGLQQMLVSTALAFYDKNPNVQYESTSRKDTNPGTDKGTRVTKLTGNGRGMRRTREVSPEYAMPDQRMFAQCSEFVYNVYWNTFGYRTLGGEKTYSSTYRPIGDGSEYVFLGNMECPEQVIVLYDANTDGTFGDRGYTDRNAAIRAFKEKRQPGDILATREHIMLYLGDCFGDGKEYAIHCWPYCGGSLRMDTGEQKTEPFGAAHIQPAYDLWEKEERVPFEPKCLLNEKQKIASRWALLRPLIAENMQQNHPSPAVISRLAYPRMAIYKALDGISIYDHLLPNQTVTLRETVANNSGSDYENLKITEPIPVGAKLLSFSDGGVAENGAITWTIRVPAGQRVSVTYTVQVDAPCGSFVTFDAGTVDRIPTRTFRQKIGKDNLSDAQKAKLAALKVFYAKDAFEDLDFVNRFYREVLGIEINLPKTIADYLALRFTRRDMKNEETGEVFPMLLPKTLSEKDAYLERMELPRHLSGRYVCLDEKDRQNDSHLRTLEILESFYQPGDVFLSFGPATGEEVPTKENIEIDIYLGKNKALRYTANGAVVCEFEPSIGRLLPQSLCVTLRPVMA